MTLQKFLLIAFLVFLLGIGVLYLGVNRVPFRHSGHEQHKSSLSTIVAALSGNNTHLLLTIPTDATYIIQENKKGV
jgi:hypothetical protein